MTSELSSAGQKAEKIFLLFSLAILNTFLLHSGDNRGALMKLH